MSMGQYFKVVIRNLVVNKIRFMQSMLAVVIGVAGMVVVLLLSFSLLNLNDGIFCGDAPGSLNTYVEQNAEFTKAVTVADMEQAAKDNPEIIKAVSPLVWSVDTVLQLRNGDKAYDAGLYGVGESYLERYPELYVQEGRFLRSMDISREQRVCVVGCNIAEELYGGEALGKTASIYGESYTIIGVLAAIPRVSDLDDYVLIPYTNARRIFGEDIRAYNNYEFYYDQYIVVANGEENMVGAKAVLADMLREKTGGDTGSVWNPGTRWTLSMYAFSMISELMKGGIYHMVYLGLMAAAVVLLVGGIGIMNMMLVSVQARVREIGIRKAFGATNRDIERQFMTEAVISTVIGGIVGVVLGVVIAVLIAVCELVVPVNGGYPYTVQLENMDLLTFGAPVLTALLVCIVIGVIFGTYPAQQAAKLEIVEALKES